MNVPDNGLESKVAVLRTDVDSLIQEFRSFAKEMRDMSLTSRQTNWGTIIAACSLVITLVGAIGYAIISPIKTEIEGNGKVATLQREIADLKIQNAQELNNARFVEIETQFRAADQSRNVQFATQQRIDAILWEKTFGTRYPSDAVYYPNIAK